MRPGGGYSDLPKDKGALLRPRCGIWAFALLILRKLFGDFFLGGFSRQENGVEMQLARIPAP